MKKMRKMRQVLLAMLLSVGALAAGPAFDAFGETGKPAPGTYRCSTYNVSGAGGSCSKMQPLVLHPDGSYRYSSTRGEWSVQDGKLLLSNSQFWGAGKIVARDTIRFEYDYRGLHHVVTWVCQECGSEAPTGRAEPAAGTAVGVSLTLEFDTAIGGVSGFAIVPAEAAASYTHNAALPAGAVQGMAWEAGPTTVALATNRNNKLRSGRRYVVFLSWPRESIPVAVLDLPAVAADYTTTLRATLDGASVLRATAPSVP